MYKFCTGGLVLVEHIGQAARDSETLNRLFSETTDPDERLELLKEMCALVQMAHLVLKRELSEFWH